MNTLTTHRIPKLYSAYAVVLSEQMDCPSRPGNHPAHTRRTQYYCKRCGTSFITTYQYKGGLCYGYSGFSDSLVYCPNCGHRHDSFVRREHVFYFPPGDVWNTIAALSMDLTIVEMKTVVLLRVKTQTMKLVPREKDDTREDTAKQFGVRTEEFRFDIKRRTTTFTIMEGSHRTKSTSYEMGGPLDRRIFKDSLLAAIQTDNLSEEVHEGTNSTLKSLRDAIRRKWKQIHGYDIGSLFVGFGTVHGRLLFPIVNLAFRMLYPDAPNLPSWLNSSDTNFKHYCRNHFLADQEAAPYADFDTVRKAKTTAEAVTRVFGLPDKPAVRRVLTDDFFAAPELVEVFKVTDNEDSALQIYEAMQEKRRRDTVRSLYYESTLPDITEAYKLLAILREHYPVRSIIAFLKRTDLEMLRDTYRLFVTLEPCRHPAFWATKPKPKELHDRLVEALRVQRAEGHALEVPEAIRRRFMMQLDSLRFFLPEHTKELVKASNTLHNCVRTYDDRVTSGECNIVFMADAKGKLTACLEVRHGALVQAKLKHNKPVSAKAAINRAVLEWANKAHLKIKTADVRVEQTVRTRRSGTQERVAV